MRPSAITLTQASRLGWLAASFRFHPGLVAVFRALPRREWNAQTKTWDFEASEIAVNAVIGTGAHITVDKDALELWQSRGGTAQQSASSGGSTAAQLTFDVRTLATPGVLPADLVWHSAPNKQQEECIRYIAGNQKFYLKMSVGTGKTWLYLNAARVAAHKLNRSVVALLVGPINKIPGYEHEVRRHIPAELGVYIDARGSSKRFSRVLDRATQEKVRFDRAERRGVVYVCLNWDALAPRVNEFWEVLRTSVDVYLEDESHLGKNPTSARGRTAMKLAEYVPYVVRGSGTPSPSPFDLWAQLNPLRPGMLPSTYTAFKKRYGVMELADLGNGRRFYQVHGWQNLHELRDVFARVSYQASADDAGIEQPIPERRYVEMTHEHRAVYEEVRRDGVLLLQSGQQMVAHNATSVLMRALQVCSGFIGLTDMDGKPLGQQTPIAGHVKHKYIMEELLPELYAERPGRQIVLWSIHRHALAALLEMATRLNVPTPDGKERRARVAHLWGDTPRNERNDIEQRFRQHDFDLLISNPQSGGTALEFQTADVMVWESRSFDYVQRAQGIGRLARLGQKNTVTNIDVLYEDTLEDYVLDANEAKESILRLLTNQPQRALTAAFQGRKDVV